MTSIISFNEENDSKVIRLLTDERFDFAKKRAALPLPPFF